MAIYEYVCESCKNEFDLMRPMKEADQPAACDTCGSRKTKRKLSLFNAQSGGKASRAQARRPARDARAGRAAAAVIESTKSTKKT